MVGKKGMKHLKKDDIEKSRDLVERLAAIGSTDEEICFVLRNINHQTLKNHFREELDRGRGSLRTALRKAQFESAINDKNTAMLIWLGKNYLGQREPRHDVKHSGDVTFQKVIYGEIDSEDDKGPVLYA